jgi:hypothetical protein
MQLCMLHCRPGTCDLGAYVHTALARVAIVAMQGQGLWTSGVAGGGQDIAWPINRLQITYYLHVHCPQR